MTELQTENYFKPAQHRALPLKLGMFGPSKSGKTYTALKLMRGIVGPTGRFAVVDTENRGSEEYQGDPEVGDFDIAPLHSNFAADRFVRVVGDAVRFGYEGIVVDGISPLWDGPGGIQAVADANQKGNNKFSGWEAASPEHQKILRTIVDCPVHLICTMRSKTAYVVEEGKPRKIGLKPVQRDGIEYEFRLLAEMDSENNMKISGRRHFQNRVIEKPGIALAKELLQYLGSVEAEAEEAEKIRAAQDTAGETPEERKARVQYAEQVAAGVATPPPTATTALPPNGSTAPVTHGTDSEPAAEVAGSVDMISPHGDRVSMPVSAVPGLIQQGWDISIDKQPDPPPSAPSITIASGGDGQETGTAPVSQESAPGGEPTEPPSGSPRMQSSQLQEIVEACQRLATIRPDKGDSAFWMEWANEKAKEFYQEDIGTLSQENAAALIERINRTALAVQEQRA